MNWPWKKVAITLQEEKTEGPYRTIAEVPPQPKVETEEERAVRMEKERMNRNAVAAMGLSMLPSAALLAIGYEWSSLSSAMAVMSIFSTILVTVGAIIAASIKLEW